MKYIWFSFVVFLFSVNTSAQQKSEFPSEITLYFDSDKSVLKSGQDAILTNFVQGALSLQSEYTIRIAAHTDSDGDVAYNDKLAMARAQEVIKLLTQQGVSLLKMVYVANGESVPVASNTTDDGKAKNRRVTITLTRPEVANADESKNAENTTFAFTFPAGTENHIETPTGTQLHIPENAFVDAAGNPVTGKVSIDYTEYRSIADFIFSDIPMHFKLHDEEVQFNSSGMFKIRAKSNNEEVFMAPGKEITIDFPLEQTIPNTNFYFFDETKKEWIELEKNISDTLGNTTNLAENKPESLLDVVYTAIPDNRDSIKSPLGQTAVSKVVFDCNQLQYKKNLMDKLIRSKDSISVLFQFTPKSTKAANVKKIKAFNQRLKILNKRLAIQTKTADDNLLICFPKILDNTLSLNIAGTNFVTNLNKINWEIQSGTVTELSPEMKLVNIIVDQNDYKIILEDDKIKTFLVKRPKGTTPEIKQMIVSCVQKIRSINALRNQQKSGITNTTKSINSNQNQIRRLNAIRYITQDSLDKVNSFSNYIWEFNKEFMPVAEKKMNKEEWFVFMDNNRAILGSRYDSILKSEDYMKCIEDKKKQYELYQKQQIVEEQIEKRIASIRIGGMGIYNCDQIYRMVQPIVADVEYVIENGEKMKPRVIFVVDKNVNGVLRYDGYNGYGPSRFAFDPDADTKILVFDELAALYRVKPDNLKNINRQTRKFIFELEKIADFPDKEKVVKLF